MEMKSFLEGYRNLCESAQTRPLSDAMRDEWRQHAEMAGLALECLARRAADEGAVEVEGWVPVGFFREAQTATATSVSAWRKYGTDIPVTVTIRRSVEPAGGEAPKP